MASCRTGGEGGDEARDMAAFGGKAGQHYLEPDDTELEIISYLNSHFDSVILLGWDILAAAAMVFMGLRLWKKFRKPCVNVVAEKEKR